MDIQNPNFEALIHDYMSDPVNNHVFEVKGRVDRVYVSARKDGEPGWNVEFFCKLDEFRSFHKKLTPEDLLGWMWVDQKKARS